jgi:hypothetical protein
MNPNRNRSGIAWIAALCLSFFAMPHSPGACLQRRPVTNVTAVKVVDGQFQNYMSYLQKNWKGVMEEAKKAGYVLDYHVYGATPHNPNEPISISWSPIPTWRCWTA